ncbi:membrane dipeptidase [Candidatus Aminicenantes bacterium AC-335-A11]|jgi:membrane dipeptidase|nr:membrane dipeptidase [SCandidatus Aminicenantes bacterium Aminicenantia_JdfR_composite]MCP2597249.1 membrane dipeptidase [Candidatus Aminicenantes bacterium AC-335-G13]MCP2618737.1 membrane dipeptidase [Candidatus Aminicenantes bacterium AC-335-A11]
MKSYIRKLFILLLILFLIPSFYLLSKEKIDPQLWQKALKIHKEAIVIDTHCDTPMLMMERGLDIGHKSEESDVDLIKMEEGGLDAPFFVIFVPNQLDNKHPAKKALEIIDEIYQQVEKYPDLAEIAYSPEDIVRIHKEGKKAILMGMENGSPIEGSLRLLRNFYRLGVRYITLTHSDNNDICDSSMAKEPKWNGLSDFGKEVVLEMNRLGMMVDISHISDKAFWDVLEISKAPVIASHSSVRSLCNVPRNLSDDMIKALAKKGGVIQINFFSNFIDEKYNKKSREIRERLKPEMEKLKEKYKDDQPAYWNAAIKLWKKYAPPPPDIETLINHIDYVVKLVGVDYVGLGSDFDGASSFPKGLEDVSGLPLITYHLLKRGYREEDIKKILGGNLLRVFREVVNTAKRLRKAG